MILEIMYKDKTVKVIKNIFSVSNLSTRFENDCLYYETLYDVQGKGTCIDFDKILCFEVKAV